MILEKLTEAARCRVEQKKKSISPETIRREAEQLEREKEFPFEKALKKQGMSLICEVKKASPSKGILAEEFPYLQIASEYEAAGADAVSCLTEPDFFLGNDRYLEEIAKTIRLPVLRKDFIVDPYMIYEAKLLGASAVLLICAVLDREELREGIRIAESLGLSVLTEVHDEKEVEQALEAGAEIIGVNNRNLKTFAVDLDTSFRLRKLVPPECVFVSESGIRGLDDIRRLRENGTDAVLIGETLMRSREKTKLLETFRTLEKEGGRSGFQIR